MIKVLFAARQHRWPSYKPHLKAAFQKADLAVDLVTQAAPDTVDYIIYAPNGTLQDFTPYTRCKAVLSLWAGVEGIVDNATLTQPLARMIDRSLTEGMVEWCVGHALRHHLNMDLHIHGQDGLWRAGHIPPLARNRIVTVLGLGALGSKTAKALAALNFQTRGWARRAKTLDTVACYHGYDGLQRALAGANMVILLLPATRDTQDMLNADTLALLAPDAVILNPGRGQLIDDDALLKALDCGQIGHATLDVFRVEPLPPEHPFWTHPKVTVTPHIASETRPETAAEIIAENIARGEAGVPFLHLVDRNAGY